jgi:ABC-2 type transport system permease protein
MSAPGNAASDSGEGTVFDLGYKPHEGPRLGRSAVMRAIVVDGLRRAVGLRRKARTKILPWALITAAILPVVIVVVVIFVAVGFELEEGNPFVSHAQYFDLIGTLSMLFVALVAPLVLIPDREDGVIAIYASRPVRAGDYLLARAGALALLTALYILIPQSLLYVGIAGLNVGGFWEGLRINSPEILPTLGATVAYVVGYGAPAFLISIYMKRLTMATGIFVIAMFLSGALVDIIPEGTTLPIYKVVAPLSMFFNPLTVRDWLFGLEGSGMPLVQVGLPQWIAALALVALLALTAWLAHRRYRREL